MAVIGFVLFFLPLSNDYFPIALFPDTEAAAKEADADLLDIKRQNG